MYFPKDFENTLLAYMIYQVMMPHPHGMYIQYKDLYWHSLHSKFIKGKRSYVWIDIESSKIQASLSVF